MNNFAKKSLLRIYGTIPNTNKEVDIPINGKNLIVTGPNGSGKTSFLKNLHNKAILLIKERALADLPSTRAQLAGAIQRQTGYVLGTSMHEHNASYIKSTEERISNIESGIQFEIQNAEELSQSVNEKTAIISFFESNRSANITHSNTAIGVEAEKERAKTQNILKPGTNLEQHLVNLKNRRSLALSEDNDKDLAASIQSWLDEFENSLKTLMEDESTHLEFNSGSLKFTIKQNTKPSYTFQSLSSGYLAILDIYSDLIMQSEYFSIPQTELSGLVFIDEIDAHLHVSLQRKILPFFEKSFPGIQFIVSTHSPFVLTSVQNAVIFDLGRNQSIDEDLSFYPYSSVMKGVLSTKTTSIVLDEMINELSTEMQKNPIGTEKIKKLVRALEPFEEELDPTSKAFYLKGVNYILDGEK